MSDRGGIRAGWAVLLFGLIVLGAGSCALGAAGEIDEEARFERASQLHRRGELRAAETFIRRRLQANIVPGLVRRYSELLARVQFESGNFKDAWQSAHRAEAILAQSPARASDIGERVQLQLFLAEIELAGQLVGPARKRLHRALELSGKSRHPLDYPHTLARLARLEEIANDDRAAAAHWSAVRDRCQAIVVIRDLERDDFTAFRSASELLSEALAADKDYAGAVKTLERLERPSRRMADELERATVIRKIAAVLRQSGDYRAERRRLTEALSLEERRPERDRGREGDILREIGDSLESESDGLARHEDYTAARTLSAQAEPYWRESIVRYAAAMKSAESPAHDGKAHVRQEPPDAMDRAREAMRLSFQLASSAQLLGDWQRAIAANLRLLEYQRQRLAESDPETHRTMARLAALFVRSGQAQRDQSAQESAARQAIEYANQAVSYWRTRRPYEPETLARALLGLVDAHEALGSKAGDTLAPLAEAVNALERSGKPVANSLKLAAYFKLGRTLANVGRYAEARDSYNRAIEIGEADARLREEYVLTLLNRAMLYKSQRLFDKALADCQRAVALQESMVEDENDARLFPMYLALAGLHIGQAESQIGRSSADNPETDALILQSLSDGERDAQRAQATLPHTEDDPRTAELWHQFALLHSLRHQIDHDAQERERAIEYWGRALTIQENTGRQAMQARTLNHLAELELTVLRATSESLELDESHHEEAVVEYEQADPETQAVQKSALEAIERALDHRRTKLVDGLKAVDARSLKSVKILDQLLAYPNLHYRTLCTRAHILRTRARWASPGERDAIHQEAIRNLEHAIALTETPREAAVGGDLARAEFFAHFATAFEDLVELYVERGELYKALETVERARNRTFLDQVRQAGGNVWPQLQDKEPKLDRELKDLLAEHYNLSQTIRLQSNPDKVLLDKLADTRQRYLELEVRIRRALGSGEKARQFDGGEQIHQALVQPDNVVLYYYLTREHTHLFVLDQRVGIRHFRLKLSEGLPAGLGKPGDNISLASLNRLVGEYLLVIKDQNNWLNFFKTSTAAAANRREETTGPLADDWELTPEQAVVLAKILLPGEVRDIVAAAKAKYVLIAPDGILHQLPFEALLVDPAGEFVLDVFPPIAYVPSAQIVASILRPYAEPRRKSAMLVVGGIKHERSPIVEAGQMIAVSRTRASRQLGGKTSFQDLPFSLLECSNVMHLVGQRYPQGAVIPLLASESTEQNVRRQIEQQDRRISCLLFSCHGVAAPDHETAQLFGYLRLSPSEKPTSTDDDGDLELHEIHRLPLRGCELAVLSACETIAGPERPLESGSTLARSFMVAGARRVVCSHWSVNDQSTASLITHFFENAVQQPADTEREINLAIALYQARRQLRRTAVNRTSAADRPADARALDQPDYSSPYYWAPFVLVGPATADKRELFGGSE